MSPVIAMEYKLGTCLSSLVQRKLSAGQRRTPRVPAVAGPTALHSLEISAIFSW